jgi:hypothetical protein
VADCRELLLTGQLARGLDLGLEPAAPAPLAPAARKPRTEAAPRRPAVAKVAAALRKLLHQLNAPAKD